MIKAKKSKSLEKGVKKQIKKRTVGGKIGARKGKKEAPDYYPPLDVKTKPRGKKKIVVPTLKKSLTPGTLCIVLAGMHKGKRVVFLKQMKSGLCLVTGPFVLNKCPLRRVNQNFLIGTATKINLPEKFKVPENVTDEYFKRLRRYNKKQKKSKKESKSKKFAALEKKNRKDQKVVDTAILRGIRKTKDRRSLCAYLSTKFSLRRKELPHLLKF